MTLADLIAALEAEDPRKVVPQGFTNPHSWRGDYMDLAFEPASNVTVGAMLADARYALRTTFPGYKGGGYTMEEYTSCWLAEYGNGDGETLGPRLLAYMLAAGEVPKGGCEATVTVVLDPDDGPRTFKCDRDAGHDCHHLDGEMEWNVGEHA